MDKIKNWLAAETKDYFAGITLLKANTRNRTLVNNLARKENNTNLNKLVYELEKLAGPTKAEPEPTDQEPAKGLATSGPGPTEGLATSSPEPPQAPNEPPTGANEPVVIVSPVPNHSSGAMPSAGGEMSPVDQLVETMQRLFQQRVQISNTLADLETDEQRKEAVDKIKELTDQYNTLAERKKIFEESGQMPAEPEQPTEAPQIEDKAALITSRDLLRSQRSKAKAALAAKPDDVTKQEKLAKIQIELTAIESKLKLISSPND